MSENITPQDGMDYYVGFSPKTVKQKPGMSAFHRSQSSPHHLKQNRGYRGYPHNYNHPPGPHHRHVGGGSRYVNVKSSELSIGNQEDSHKYKLSKLPYRQQHQHQHQYQYQYQQQRGHNNNRDYRPPSRTSTGSVRKHYQEPIPDFNNEEILYRSYSNPSPYTYHANKHQQEPKPKTPTSHSVSSYGDLDSNNKNIKYYDPHLEKELGFEMNVDINHNNNSTNFNSPKVTPNETNTAPVDIPSKVLPKKSKANNKKDNDNNNNNNNNKNNKKENKVVGGTPDFTGVAMDPMSISNIGPPAMGLTYAKTTPITENENNYVEYNYLPNYERDFFYPPHHHLPYDAQQYDYDPYFYHNMANRNVISWNDGLIDVERQLEAKLKTLKSNVTDVQSKLQSFTKESSKNQHEINKTKKLSQQMQQQFEKEKTALQLKLASENKDKDKDKDQTKDKDENNKSSKK